MSNDTESDWGITWSNCPACGPLESIRRGIARLTTTEDD